MTRTIEQILGKRAIAAVRKPLETAGGLPGAAYTGQEFFDLEQTTLFPRTWMGVGFESDIPKPGDAMPIMVGKLPVILVRNKAGEIKAFHNVCRHRASMVVMEPQKGLNFLTCPYHAWAWDLDGGLKAMPYFDGTKNSRNTDLDKCKLGLAPVRCAVWHHWIFVNLDGKAPPIEQHMKPFADLIKGADIGATRISKRLDWEFDANWKFQNDNWETYHHAWVHGGIFNKMSEDLDMKTGEPWTESLQDGSFVTLKARKGRPARPNTGRKGDVATPLPEIPQAPCAERTLSTSILFPNVTITMMDNYIATVISDPIAPDRTVARLAFYFVGGAAKSKKYAAGRKQVLDRWLGKSRSSTGRDGIRSQDFGIWEAQQIARQSPVADDVVFSPVWESNIHHFQNQVLDTMQG
ncbi:MAG: Rieske 2Fe-2S domain-containing protein [Alphaproteobacteria bacterium]|nr:Rieske 2Fe-2S domain-containing protein [Alphaproteobacteria bacterium]